MADDKKLTVHLATTGDDSGIKKIDDALVDLSAADAKRTAEQERAYQEFQNEKKQLIAEESRLREALAAKEKADFEAFSDRFDKDQQKRQAAAEKAIATEEKARDKSERNTLAEETATAAKTTALLQRIAQLRDLASQATQAGKEIETAYNAIANSTGTATEQLELAGKAGVDAAGNIAAAWAAGGPVLGVVTAIVQLKDGLIALFKSAEEIQADLAEDAAGRVEAAQARLDAVLAKANGTGPNGRETALKEKAAADKSAADAAKQAEADARREKERQDLDRREIPDPVKRKEAEVSDRAANDSGKAAREQSALQRQLDNEKALREKLGAALAESEAERSRLIDSAERLKAGMENDGPDGQNKKDYTKRLAEISANQQEQERTQVEVRKSNGRANELKRQQETLRTNTEADAPISERRGNLDLSDARAAEAARAARQAEAEARAREAEVRRLSSQKKLPGSKGIIDDDRVGNTADDALGFAKSKAAPSDRLTGGDARLNNLTKAANALKDGATAKELQDLDKAISALSGTILTSKRADNERLQQITQKIATLTKDLAATNGRAANARD